MAIERVRTLSAMSLHFATVDIKDEAGNIIIPRGGLKNAQLEHSEYLAENGEVIPGTQRRVTSSARDLAGVPEIGTALIDSVARATAARQDAEARAAAAEKDATAARAEAAKARQPRENV